MIPTLPSDSKNAANMTSHHQRNGKRGESNSHMRKAEGRDLIKGEHVDYPGIPGASHRSRLERRAWSGHAIMNVIVQPHMWINEVLYGNATRAAVHDV